METFFDRMKWLIDKFGKSRKHTFGRKAMIPKGTMQRYVSDRIPSAEHLVRIHETFDVNLNWLFTGRGERIIARPDGESEKTDELISAARRVLQSDTHWARSLAANIVSFDRGLDSEQNYRKRAAGIDRKEGSIREGDPPGKKGELLKMRAG